MEKNIIKKINEYLKAYFPIPEESEVLFTIDPATDKKVAFFFQEAIKILCGKVVIIDCGESIIPYRSVPDRFHEQIMSFKFWIDFTEQTSVHSLLCKKFVKQGGHYLLLPGLSEGSLEKAIVYVDSNFILNETRKISSLFRKGGEIKIISTAGTDITVSLMSTKMSFSRASELMQQKGTEVMFYGYALMPINFDDMQGTLVVEDYVWPPNDIRLIKEPLRLQIKNGKIVDIKKSMHSESLKIWLNSFEGEDVYKITHLTLGLLPGLKLIDSILINERIKGALTFGFGNVWSGESPTHTDMVVLNHDVYLNDKKTEFF